MDEHFFIFNGKFLRKNTPVITAGNRGFTYGDGLFETISYRNHTLANWGFHMDRFFSGLAFLKFVIPLTLTPALLLEQVHSLLKKNAIPGDARVRLMAFRRNESLFDTEIREPHYIIEAGAAAFDRHLPKDGLSIGIFDKTMKSCGALSNIKSNNYLAGVLAVFEAREQGFDEMIFINQYGRLAETTTANIFIVKDQNISTPFLSEGCVAGTVRRWILENQGLLPFPVQEARITLDQLKDADEIFITNALKPVRWVSDFEGIRFSPDISRQVSALVYSSM